MHEGNFKNQTIVADLRQALGGAVLGPVSSPLSLPHKTFESWLAAGSEKIEKDLRKSEEG